ncbi:MAG: beta-N-acetylhexosaminidase [Ruminiclostridium sp.]|nr:beta-N-acetylhexosaminidase [Ruminiclostridium sp.]
MKLRLEGDISGLEKGIEIIGRELSFELTEDGLPVKVEKTSGNIEVEFIDGKGVIRYNQKIHFFRALGLFIEIFRGNTCISISEKPLFTMNGVMLDCSRNAVMKAESIKLMLRKMALMGLNMLMLYIEDTYTIESMPYFGYMRGRYTYSELKECDDYADIFGIEMIPCIQTLAHLTQALKWNYASGMKDTDDILLVGEERTYQFIEEMVRCASAPFRSKRIHIGMDEAEVGRGKYLDINGYRNRFEILEGHVAKVVEIASKYRLEPIMWSDMYFRFASEKHDYYDLGAVVPESVIEKVPQNLDFAYWDYEYHDEDIYRELIKRHKRFRKNTIMCTCVWTWLGFCTNYGKSFSNIDAALNACKKEGIKEVLTTVWLNNGAEGNIFSTLLGMQLHAEHGYADEVETEKLKTRFNTCTGGDYEAFTDLKYLDETPGTVEGNLISSTDNKYSPANPSKFLLWQDILIGLLEKHMEGLNLDEHYAGLEIRMKNHIEKNGDWDFLFEVPQKLCSVLSLKCEIALTLKSNYEKGDMESIKQLVKYKLPELYTKVNDLRIAHREQWFRIYKPFGWEVLDIRYGGLLARIDSAISRLSGYVEGRIEKIEELEEERLYFDGPVRNDDIAMCNCWQYDRIATAGSTLV